MVHIVNKLNKSDYTQKIDLVASQTTVTVTDDFDYKLSRANMLEGEWWHIDSDIVLLIATRVLNGKVHTYNALYDISDKARNEVSAFEVIKPIGMKYNNLLEFLSNRYNFFATLSDDDFKYFSKSI